MIDGQRYSHIIDARTGYPARGDCVSVSVFGPDCMTADALATAISILGFEDGRQMLATHFPNTECLMIVLDNSDGTERLRLLKTDGLEAITTVRLRSIDD